MAGNDAAGERAHAARKRARVDVVDVALSVRHTDAAKLRRASAAAVAPSLAGAAGIAVAVTTAAAAIADAAATAAVAADAAQES